MVWGCLLQLPVWLAFQGKPGAGSGVGREKREELKKTRAVCEQAGAPLAGQSRGEDMLVLGVRQIALAGSTQALTVVGGLLMILQPLDCHSSSRAAPPASKE